MKEGQIVDKMTVVKNGKIVGIASVTKGEHDVQKHLAGLGIGLSKEHRGYSIGKKLMRILILSAKKELQTEILHLSVYSKNRVAINLYKNLGFRKYGKLPKAIRIGKNYQTGIFMYKVLK